MYLRVTRVQTPLDRLDDIVQQFKGTALPAIQKLPGYAGSVLGIDRSSGDGQVATFWESAEALQTSASAAAGIRSEATQASGGKVISVQEYEIALLERAGPPVLPAFLRVVRADVDPAKIDAMVEATRSQALPVLRNLSGFRALNVSVDRGSGLVQVTGVWSTEADREASDAKIAAIRSDIFQIGGATNPEISRYEVLAVEFVGAGMTATA